MKLLIIGRKGVGKQVIANTLISYGLDYARPISTRPDTGESGDWTYVSEEEMERTRSSGNIVQEMNIGGYPSVITKEILEQSDVCITSPETLSDLLNAIPDEMCMLVRIVADEEERRANIIETADFPAAEEKVYDMRKEEEDSVFLPFETMIEDSPEVSDNCYRVITVQYDYTEESLHQICYMLRETVQRFENFNFMLDVLVDDDQIETDEEYKIILRNGDEEAHLTSEETTMAMFDDDSAWAYISKLFMGLPEIRAERMYED